MEHSDGPIRSDSSAPMDFTGERFVPSLTGPIKYEHLHRYALAGQLVKGIDVLDLACGEGYGTNLLARTASSVIGIDNSAAAIDHASKNYSRPNASFLIGTCEAIPVPTASIDAVVSFETLEHVRKQNEMLREIRRVLRPGGFLMISTPDKAQYSDKPSYKNPFHAKELYFQEFQDLLHKYFANIQIYGQRLATASFVHPLDGTAQEHWTAFTGDADHLVQETGRLDSALYFIALCSDSASRISSDRMDSVYIDGSDDVLAQIRGEWDEQGRKWEAIIRHQEYVLKQNGEELTDLAAQIQTRNEELTGLAAQIQNKDIEIDTLHGQQETLSREREILQATLKAIYVSRGWQILSFYHALRHALHKIKQGVAEPSRILRKYVTVRREKKLLAASGLFDENWYLQQNPDVARSGENPLDHYLRCGASDGRDPNPLFDNNWYLQRYPDIAKAGINPLLHYLQSGAREGRDPNPLFDTAWYVLQYPEIASTGVNPLADYLRAGAQQGHDPHPLFDSDWYLQQYPEIAKAGINPLADYLDTGAQKGRDPNPLFDSDWYLQQHPDVTEAGTNPLVDYLQSIAGAAFAKKTPKAPKPLRKLNVHGNEE